jgi:hypothetical protein
MEGLFFGNKHALHFQNPTRSTNKVILSPLFFLRTGVKTTNHFSRLDVEVLSKRDPMTLDSTRAEFRREVEELFVGYFGANWDKIAVWLTVPPSWTCIRNVSSLPRAEVIQKLEVATDHLFRISPVALADDLIRLDFSKQPNPFLPLPPSRVIVDTGCGEAVLRGADVFAPGVKGTCMRLGLHVAILAHTRHSQDALRACRPTATSPSGLIWTTLSSAETRMFCRTPSAGFSLWEWA